MDFANADPATITDFHAHIYYHPAATIEAARRLRLRVAQRFPGIRVGGWHDELVGPHLRSMYQLLFAPADFAEVVPWLMLNREGLDILIHPSAGDAYNDHMIHGLWLGDKLALNEPHLRRDYDAAAQLRAAVLSGEISSTVTMTSAASDTSAAAKKALPE